MTGNAVSSDQANSTHRARVLLFSLMCLCAAPAAATAQACVGHMGDGRIAIFGAVGSFRYDLEPAVNGTEIGAGAAVDLGPLAVEATAATRSLDSDASLVVARGDGLMTTPPLPFVGQLCVAGGLGLARLSENASGTATTIITVPIGLRFGTRLGLADGLEPFVQPRLVLARNTGEAFGLQVGRSAVGAGVDGGVTVFAGPLVTGVVARWTSLNQGLGPHAGMDIGATIRVGLRF